MSVDEGPVSTPAMRHFTVGVVVRSLPIIAVILMLLSARAEAALAAGAQRVGTT